MCYRDIIDCVFIDRQCEITSRSGRTYNNIFRMLLCIKRREVYNAYVCFNIDSLQIILRKTIYRFNVRLLDSANSLVSNIIHSMSFLSGSKLHIHWRKVLYKA